MRVTRAFPCILSRADSNDAGKRASSLNCQESILRGAQVQLPLASDRNRRIRSRMPGGVGAVADASQSRGPDSAIQDSGSISTTSASTMKPESTASSSGFSGAINCVEIASLISSSDTPRSFIKAASSL